MVETSETPSRSTHPSSGTAGQNRLTPASRCHSSSNAPWSTARSPRSVGARCVWRRSGPRVPSPPRGSDSIEEDAQLLNGAARSRGRGVSRGILTEAQQGVLELLSRRRRGAHLLSRRRHRARSAPRPSSVPLLRLLSRQGLPAPGPAFIGARDRPSPGAPGSHRHPDRDAPRGADQFLPLRLPAAAAVTRVPMGPERCGSRGYRRHEACRARRTRLAERLRRPVRRQPDVVPLEQTFT